MDGLNVKWVDLREASSMQGTKTAESINHCSTAVLTRGLFFVIAVTQNIVAIFLFLIASRGLTLCQKSLVIFSYSRSYN